MADACPNPNDPNFKSDVATHGEKGAYKKFVENGNKVPEDSVYANTGIDDRGYTHGNDILDSQEMMDHAYKRHNGKINFYGHQAQETQVYAPGSTESGNFLLQGLKDAKVFKEDLSNEELSKQIENPDRIGWFIDEIFKRYQSVYKAMGTNTPISELTRNEIKEYFKTNPEAVKKFTEYVDAISNGDLQKLKEKTIGAKYSKDSKTKIPIPYMTQKEFIMFESIEKMSLGGKHQSKSRTKIIKNENSWYDRSSVVNEIIDKIKIQHKHRNKIFDKLPEFMKPVVGKIEQFLGNINNARLISKYLSGSDKSNFSNLFYKPLEQASANMLSLQRRMNEQMAIKDKEWLESVSHYHGKRKSINDYDTVEFSFYTGNRNEYGDISNKNKITIPLTKMEALSMYMNMRVQRGDLSDPRSRIMRDNVGIVLDEIPGRELYETVYPENMAKFEQQLIDLIENDQMLKDVVSKMDEALEERYEEVNKSFGMIAGYQLEKINNYFPAMYGEKRNYFRKTPKSVVDITSVYERAIDEEGISPVRISDAFEVMSRHNFGTSHYASFAIPINENRKVLHDIRNGHTDIGVDKLHQKVQNDLKMLFDQWEKYVNMNEDPGNMMKSEGEKQMDRVWNKLNNSFALSVLGWNIPVMMKQTASYQLAKEVIDSKYLNKAGFGIGGFISGVNPSYILKSLKLERKFDNSILPLEFRADESNPMLVEMKKYSPMMASRVDGYINRELGEAVMGGNFGNETIVLRHKGKKFEIRKDRFMEGIKTFDTATILGIWQAVRYEAMDKGFQEGSDNFYEYVATRTEEIVAKTQPTYDNANRMSLAMNRDPFSRMLTMFSSATSKIAQVNVEATIDYMNNPTAENRNKMLKRYANTTFGVGGWIVGVNMLWYGSFALLGGDDEEINKIFSSGYVVKGLAASAAGQFPVIRDVFSGIITRVDKEYGWKDNMSLPIEDVFNTGLDAAGATINMINPDYEGDRMKQWKQSYTKGMDVLMKTNGVPVSAFKAVRGTVNSLGGNM